MNTTDLGFADFNIEFDGDDTELFHVDRKLNPTYDRHYARVFPRDFFNEGKLLKCLGRLMLLHVDGFLSDGCSFCHTKRGAGFIIGQDPADGNLGCSNFHMWHVEKLPDNKTVKTYISLFTPLNARDAYPLMAHVELEDEPIEVFDTEGNLTPEFNARFGYRNERGA